VTIVRSERSPIARNGANGMNEIFKELKDRMRRLDALLESRGSSQAISLAQAISSLHRAARRGDRSRAPSPELVSLLERAEDLGRRLE
jgi:hypothetical protein